MHGFLKYYQSQVHCKILNQWQRGKFLFSSQDFRMTPSASIAPKKPPAVVQNKNAPEWDNFPLGLHYYKTQGVGPSFMSALCWGNIAWSHPGLPWLCLFLSLWPAISINVFLLTSCSKTHKAGVDLHRWNCIVGLDFVKGVVSLLYSTDAFVFPFHHNFKESVEEQYFNPENCQCIYCIRNVVFSVL